LAAVEPWLPARRKKPPVTENVLKLKPERDVGTFSGRPDAALYGRQGWLRLHFQTGVQLPPNFHFAAKVSGVSTDRGVVRRDSLSVWFTDKNLLK
jgi:hypothetical protein